MAKLYSLSEHQRAKAGGKHGQHLRCSFHPKLIAKAPGSLGTNVTARL